jgi:hypothetical protein
LYCAALLFVKMTFLFQYYRVLAVQKMRKIYLACMVIVGGWALSQVLVGIFMCHPIAGFWDSSIKATCIPNTTQWYTNAAGNIITDVVVFALPLPAIWSLQLARPSKYILLGIFSLGFLYAPLFHVSYPLKLTRHAQHRHHLHHPHPLPQALRGLPLGERRLVPLVHRRAQLGHHLRLPAHHAPPREPLLPGPLVVRRPLQQGIRQRKRRLGSYREEDGYWAVGSRGRDESGTGDAVGFQGRG